jgi:hypothetical protein
MVALGPVLPPQQIARILRSRGFAPQATPVRNGEAYQVRAIDRLGRQVRVAVDARYGDILAVRPIAMAPAGAYGSYGPPPYQYGYYGYGGPAPEPYPGLPGVRAMPSDRSAGLAPPPLPRPKPVAKPAAAPAAPAPAPEVAPAPPAPTASPPPANQTPAAPPAAAPAPPAAAPSIPPVAPLE